MSNTVAVVLFATIILAFAVNFAMGWEAHIFLARKLMDLIDWMAFWR